LFQPNLTDPNAASSTTTFFFYGCWFKNNPWDFDVTQEDLKMIQEINITAAGVRRG
jgi:hypothetical protein